MAVSILAMIVSVGLLGAAAGVSPTPAAAADLQHGAGEVLATVDGVPITEAGLGDAARAAIHQAKTGLYEARRKAAEEAVGTILLEREARRRGVTLEQLLDAEVYSKVGQISPQEVKDFYVANQARIRQPLERVGPEIERHLKNQRAASWRAALVSELRKGSTIALLIDPPRVRVGASGPSRGPATAPVTIVEFSDFQCPFCAQAGPILRKVADTYGDRVRIVYRDFPLDTHVQARKAAEAARCADEQGKFWEYHDTLLANQQALDVDALKNYAEQLGLDVTAFSACVTSSKFRNAVDDDRQEGQRLGIGGTPTFFVNGWSFVGVPSFDAIRAVIDEELQRVAARESRPKTP